MKAESLSIPKTVVIRILKQDLRRRTFFLVARQCSNLQSCKCLPIFDPKKMLQLFITPVLFICISAILFSVPQVKKKLKGLHFADIAEIQEAVPMN
jgi:hypothetical protein